MKVLQIPELEAYPQRLREDAAEVSDLFRDLLTSVTGFFRDPEAFEALRCGRHRSPPARPPVR
ncbi:hypothetical protein CLV79_10733 [Limimaricola soesokkakensis]|uniref:Uncharacterized protein n=1 Tax=Limimaricola soesokkakensis TaxID=1343159 RepID=A0A1X6ZQY7_9RHOB|nr:hypothetical protein CLV79_10733 [Limimaricola soesokkakensis]SLN56930.1 hypothetical protein LOS8367_02707 [Limimaricola soesokkakensis]